MAKKQLTYTEAITELENILAEIENNEPDVDELTAKVKRAAYLLRYCREKLRKASGEVNGILKNMEEEEEGD